MSLRSSPSHIPPTSITNNIPLVASLLAAGYGTIFEGTFILSCLPIVFAYWGIATINQAIRKIGLPLSKLLTDEDRTYALTLAASKQKKARMNKYTITFCATFSTFCLPSCDSLRSSCR